MKKIMQAGRKDFSAKSEQWKQESVSAEKPQTKPIYPNLIKQDHSQLVNLNFNLGSLHEYLDNVKTVLNQHASIINSIKVANNEKLDELDLVKWF